MKKVMLISIITLVFSMTFASAFSFDDWFRKIIGLSPPEVDMCSTLNQEVIDRIEELQANDKVVILREGDQIVRNDDTGRKDYFVIATQDGGRILRIQQFVFDVIENRFTFEFQDAITFDTVADLVTDENDQTEFYFVGDYHGYIKAYSVSSEERYITLTWGEGATFEDGGTQLDTFIDCNEVGECTENWVCEDWSECVDGQRTRECNDVNLCGTEEDIPPLVEGCVDGCEESWSCSDWSACVDNMQTRTCTDANNCGTEDDQPEESQLCGCLDSDEGISEFALGIVHYGERHISSSSDVCQDDNTLSEKYCAGEESVTEEINCEFGCVDGVCKKETGNDETTNLYICQDSDPEQDYFIEGMVEHGIITPEGNPSSISHDFCTSSETLKQHYCENGYYGGFDEYTCPESCYLGICTSEGFPPGHCEDGTPFWSCSTNKPLYCDNGILIDNCGSCGCDSDLICQDEGSCIQEECEDECSEEGQEANCGYEGVFECGYYDEDECLEWGPCIGDNHGPPLIPLQASLETSSGYVNGDPAVFPIGQIFSVVDSFVEDRSNTGIDSVIVDIIVNGEIIASTELTCIPDDYPPAQNEYDCTGGTWHADDVEVDIENIYIVRTIATDNLGQVTTKDRVYNILFVGIDPTLCKELIPGHNDPEANRANYVFLGFGYENTTLNASREEIVKSLGTALMDQQATLRGLLSVSPFKENPDKFNFWYISEVYPIDNCEPGGGIIDCIDDQALAASCVFSNKYVSYLIDQSFIPYVDNSILYLSAPLSRPTIKEYSCDAGQSTFEPIECPDTCFDGACTSETVYNQTESNFSLSLFNFTTNGDENIVLEVPITDTSISLDFLYGSGEEFLGMGEHSEKRLAVSNSNTLTYYETLDGQDYHENFITSYIAQTESESFLLRANIETDTVTISKYGEGSWQQICPDRVVGQTCSIGSTILTVESIDYIIGELESATFSSSDDASFNRIFDTNNNYINLPTEEIFPIEEIEVNVFDSADNFVEQYLMYWEFNNAVIERTGGNSEDCYDSDLSLEFPDGKNIFLQGTVTDTNGSYTDECLPSGRINRGVIGYTNEYFETEIGLLVSDTIQAVFVHEVGHHFASLKDEYILYGTNLSQTTSYKNCYLGPEETQEECLESSQWVDFIGNGCGEEGIIDCEEGDEYYNLEIGCYEGCSWENVFRSARKTIMRTTPTEPYSFGKWNEFLIQEILDQFDG
jgi:predicted Zn-dependent protease with MMP-like domain